MVSTNTVVWNVSVSKQKKKTLSSTGATEARVHKQKV